MPLEVYKLQLLITRLTTSQIDALKFKKKPQVRNWIWTITTWEMFLIFCPVHPYIPFELYNHVW